MILGTLAAITAAVVLVLVLRGGSSHRAAPVKPAATATTPARLAAQITLKPAPRVTARGFAAVIQRDGQRVVAIAASGLRPTSTHLAYGVWLYNTPADAQLIGFVPPVKADGRISAAAPLPSSATRFHALVLTREGGNQQAARPGQILLRGALPGGAAG